MPYLVPILVQTRTVKADYSPVYPTFWWIYLVHFISLHLFSFVFHFFFLFFTIDIIIYSQGNLFNISSTVEFLLFKAYSRAKSIRLFNFVALSTLTMNNKKKRGILMWVWERDSVRKWQKATRIGTTTDNHNNKKNRTRKSNTERKKNITDWSGIVSREFNLIINHQRGIQVVHSSLFSNILTDKGDRE